MKKSIAALMLILALGAGYIGARLAPSSSAPISSKQESAYARVMRTGVLRCAYMQWPTYFERNPNTGEITGLGAEIYREMVELIGLKIEYVESVIGQQVEDLNNAKVDAVCNDSYYLFSSVKFEDYTVPAYLAPVFVAVRQNEKRFSKPQDLNREDVTFIGIDGDVGIELARRHYPKAKLLTLPGSVDAASLLMYVTMKKADATINDPQFFINFNATNKPGVKILFENTPEAVYPVGMGVKKGEQELLNMLNYGFNAMWNVGIAGPILKKYDPTGKALYAVAKSYEEPR